MALKKLALSLTSCRAARVGSWVDSLAFMPMTSSQRPVYQFNVSGLDLAADTTIRSMKIVFDISNTAGTRNSAEVCLYASSTIIGAPAGSATTVYNAIGSATPFASAIWGYVGPTSRQTTEIVIPSGQWATILTRLRTVGYIAFGFRLPVAAPSAGLSYSTDLTAMGGTSIKAVDEPSCPPVLLIEYDPARNTQLNLQMRYTASSPSVTQSTPQNSLGGFYSANSVYDSFRLKRGVARADMVVPLESLPTPTSGLLAIGPEAVRYSSETDDSVVLSARNIAHNGAVPVGSRPYGDMESVYLLSLNKLFNTSVLSGSQYRCIAVVHAGPSLPIQNIQVSLAQARSSKALLEYGIEVPAWNAQTGTQLNSPPYAGSTKTVHDTNFAGQPDGYYDGGYIYFNAPMSEWGRIDTYTTDGTFVLTADAVYGSIPGNQTFYLAPAPSQSVVNEHSAPLYSETFDQFVPPDNAVDAVLVGSPDGVMRQNDCFYIWLKRTLTPHTAGEDDLAAVLTIRYRHSNLLITGSVYTSAGIPRVGFSVTGNSTTVLTDNNGAYALPVPVAFTGNVTCSGATTRAYRNLLTTMSAQDFFTDVAQEGQA